MSILTIKNLSHMYDHKVLLDNCDLAVNNGERLGVVGLNGAGKTTFMNILCKKILQDSGEVNWINNIRWGYLDQHADIDRNISMMDYLKGAFDYLYQKEAELNDMYMKMGEVEGSELDKLIEKSAKLQDYLMEKGIYEVESQIKKVASGLGLGSIGYDSLIKTLSGGQRAKLILSKLLLENLDVMLLDEPTNFLDVAHIEWLKNYLNKFEGTYMVISHDTTFLDAVCTGIISVENGVIKKYSGNYSSYKEQHEMNRKQYAESYERQQREIKKMEEYIARNKARAATAGMANSRKKMLDRIDVMSKPVEFHPASFNFPYSLASTKEHLSVKGLKIGYNAKQLVPDINFTIDSQSKLWLKGANGIGKTTFIKTLMGIVDKIDGNFKFNVNAKVSYIEQDLEFRNVESNAAGYISDCYPKMSQKDIRSELAKAGIKGELAIKSIFQMSGGEQVRVKLCALSQKESNLLILDEPTNHLDVMAKDALKEALIKYEGSIILVSHEPAWAEDICNCSYDLEEGIFKNRNYY